MRTLALVTLLTLVTACAGKSAPEQHYYLLPLEIPAGTKRIEEPMSVGLSRLKVADYLSQKGIVLETLEGTIRPARYHQWAEPLSEGLRHVLRAQISTALGYDISADTVQRSHWDVVLDAEIERLHGTLSGEAVLIAFWRLTPALTPENTVVYRFSQTRPLQREGYSGLVEAETALLNELSSAIADSIREIQPLTDARDHGTQESD
jgi:uncharacterized lipoprotein YmbA